MSSVSQCRTSRPGAPLRILEEARSKRRALPAKVLEEPKQPLPQRQGADHGKKGSPVVLPYSDFGISGFLLRTALKGLGINTMEELSRFTERPDWRETLQSQFDMGPDYVWVVENLACSRIPKERWDRVLSHRAMDALEALGIDSFGSLVAFMEGPGWDRAIRGLKGFGPMVVRELEETCAKLGIAVAPSELIVKNAKARRILDGMRIKTNAQLRAFVESDERWYLPLIKKKHVTWAVIGSMRKAASQAGVEPEFISKLDISKRFMRIFNELGIKGLADLKKFLSDSSWQSTLLHVTGFSWENRGSYYLIKEFRELADDCGLKMAI